MKRKLLVFTSTFPRWQNDTDPPFVYELSRRLTDDFEVTVLAPHYPGARRKEIMEGMQVYRFRYFFERFEKLAGSTGILPTLKNNRFYFLLVPFFLAGQLLSLLSLCRKIQPDVIHAHWLIPQGFIASFTNMITNIPVVVTAHGADVFGLLGAFFKIIKSFVVNKASTVTVVSEALARELKDYVIDPSKVKIIPMGVSSERFSPERRNSNLRGKYSLDGPFLLYAGRLTEKKGVKYLIKAMKYVAADIPECRLLIVGSGELEGDLQQQVRELKLSDNIIFLGAVSNEDMPAYYATADIFIGPSIQVASGDTEGFGLTFVEAAMCGCAIIGSDVGGIGDIIQHKGTGLLVRQKDSRAIADAVKFCLQNRATMSKLAVNARQDCIRKYDWQVIVGKYTSLLKEVEN